MIEVLFKCLNVVTTTQVGTQLKFIGSYSTFFRCIHNQTGRYCTLEKNSSKTSTNGNSDKNGTDNHHIIFLYGTLKKGEPNHKLLGEQKGVCVYLGPAKTLKKWPLVIASRYNIPYLLYCEGKGKQVVGELYEVDNSVLEELDKLECHPKYYERTQEETLFFSKKEIRICWIYFLKKYSPHLLDLPFFENYSSNGPHGLKYVESEETSDPEDIW